MKRIKVKYSKLGKQKVWGFDLEILLHECLHILNPTDSEEEVVTKSVILTNTLWGEKYRRVDESPHPPLQDGSI